MSSQLYRYLISTLKFKYLVHKAVKRKCLLRRSPFQNFLFAKHFCSKVPRDENGNSKKVEGKEYSKIKSIEDQNCHITDDKDFEKRFWEEYEKKMATEREKEDALPYPDRIRYRKVYKDPLERTFGILKDDILEYFGKLKHQHVAFVRNAKAAPKPTPRIQEIFPNYCDVVIIGGGLVGSSIAFHLQEKTLQGLRIVVVEKDLSYSRASSVLSVGGVRQQFSTPENIILSRYMMDFLKLAKERLHVNGSDPPDIPITFNGYLTLASEKGADHLIDNFNMQRSHDASVQLFSKKKLKTTFPWINTDGVEIGVYGMQREGWIDPWSLLVAITRKTKELGTIFVNGTVTSVEKKPLGDMVKITTSPTTMYQVKNVNVKLPNGDTREINCALCVIATGCSSGEVGRLFGIGAAEQGNLAVPIPVEPRKRFVYCISSPNGPGLNCPLVVNPSGAYFRREGLADMYLCGQCPHPNEEPGVDNLSVDHDFFEEKIWPNIAHTCPSFETLKVKSSWAGFYDYNTFDQNSIIGRHPMFSNLFMATGFSGHGIQHAPGTGLALSELMLDGEYTTIDLERLGFERILLQQPLFERCIY